MKITLGNTTYTKFASLSFDPQTDIAGNKLVINQFSADIITQDNITSGVPALLYDDSDNLWADYWCVEAVRINTETVQVIARSRMILLDRVTMAAKYYNGVAASVVVAEIFSGIDTQYELDNSVASVSIIGFCPEQTARERLQWVVFVIGAYVQTYFTDKIVIKLIDETETAIPKERTYWKPSVKYGNYVTGVRVTAYSYTQGAPQTTDKWVTDGTNYYIQTTQDYTLSNPSVPPDAPENIVTVKNVNLINPNNVSGILTQLSKYYFKRVEVDLDAVDNGEYIPGDKVLGYVDDQMLVEGYINSATFTFGLQSKAQLHIMQTDQVNGDTLVILYKYGNSQIGRVEYYFPVGYSYTIENPFLDVTAGGRRRVYRPLAEAASGVIVDGGVEDEEQYEIALEYKENVLAVFSVASVDESNNIVRIR